MRTRLTTAVMLATLLIAMTASNALAAPTTYGDVTIVTPEELEKIRDKMLKQSTPKAGMAGAAFGLPGKTIIQNNPYGCYGQSHNPHATNRYNQRVALGKADSACPSDQPNMPFLRVQTQLYKEHTCIGSICFGVMEWGPSVTVVDTNTKFVRAESYGACLNGYYKTSSAHQMTGPNNKHYLAFTVKRAYVGNC